MIFLPNRVLCLPLRPLWLLQISGTSRICERFFPATLSHLVLNVLKKCFHTTYMYIHLYASLIYYHEYVSAPDLTFYFHLTGRCLKRRYHFPCHAAKVDSCLHWIVFTGSSITMFVCTLPTSTEITNGDIYQWDWISSSLLSVPGSNTWERSYLLEFSSLRRWSDNELSQEIMIANDS